MSEVRLGCSIAQVYAFLGGQKIWSETDGFKTSALIQYATNCWIQIEEQPSGCECRLYAGVENEVHETGELLKAKFKARRLRSTPRFHVLIRDGHGSPDLESVNMNASWRLQQRRLEALYGNEFVGWNERIIQWIRSENQGICLLAGSPGTGKTSYLRHLIASLGSKVRFVYLPPSFLSILADPGFTSFWLKQVLRRERNTVLVVEDAEEILLEPPAGSPRSTATSNLLNATDGLLGDVFQAKVICSFNTAIEQLDSAIVRAGRLYGSWTFSPAPLSRAQAICKEYALPEPTGEAPFTLAQIFHRDFAREATTTPQRNTIGFTAGSSE